MPRRCGDAQEVTTFRAAWKTATRPGLVRGVVTQWWSSTSRVIMKPTSARARAKDLAGAEVGTKHASRLAGRG